MAERGIIFSGPMVRALLDGRKTQTRRMIRFPVWACGCFDDPLKIEIEADEHGRDPEVICNDTGCLTALPLPWRLGDRLWVRETWQLHSRASDLCSVVYRASVGGGWTEAHKQFPDAFAGSMRPRPFQAGWRSPIHVPRWASRLTLIVTDVRVERLRDISEADADAEGFAGDFPWKLAPDVFPEPYDQWGALSIPECYGILWHSIHGPGAWDANPWVAAITFEQEPRHAQP